MCVLCCVSVCVVLCCVSVCIVLNITNTYLSLGTHKHIML